MADQYTQLLYGLAGVGIAGFIGWAIRSITSLNASIKDLELRIAKEYVKNSAVDDFKLDLKEITKVVYGIAGKLNVSIGGNNG
jgi:hypothetical protein